MGDFKDKIVLITGAGRGIGRAIAQAFAARGAAVAANDINPTSLDETVTGIQSAGGRAKAYIFDAAKRMPVAGMVSQVLEDWGRVDILVNHAAVRPQASILELDEWDFHRTLDVNLGGPFFAMQICGRAMRKQGGGVILNLGASGGDDQGPGQQAAYTASKAGLVALTQAAGRELADDHIRVNALCPGANTGLAANGAGLFLVGPAGPDGVALQERLAGALPAGLSWSEAVAAAALFLCSPAAAGITGQVIGLGSANRPTTNETGFHLSS